VLSIKKLLTKILLALSSGSADDYLKLPNGVLIQWGSITIPSGSYVANIDLSQTFIDRTKLSIHLTPVQSGTTWNVNYAATTTSNISIGRTPNTTASTYYWLAIGRWKNVGGGTA